MDNLEFKPWQEYKEEEQANEGFNVSTDYTDPNNETEGRNQLQSLHSQTKKYINEQLVPEVSKVSELEEHEINSLVGDGNIVVVKNGKDYLVRLDVTPTGVTKEYVDNQDASNLQTAKDYTDSKTVRTFEYSNITQTGTPTALEDYRDWDTKHEYGYYLDVLVTGLEETMNPISIVLNDVTQEIVGMNCDVLDGKVRFYLKSNEEVTLTIVYMMIGISTEIPPISSVYPIGSVYFSIANVNPSTLFGGTWELIGTKLAVRENVFGNGKTLGVSDGINNGGLVFDVYSSTHTILAGTMNGYGKDVGESLNPDFGQADKKAIGVMTKEQLGDNLENSGLIVDTETIYSWKRTA